MWAQDPLNPVWEDTFTFVVEKPLGARIVMDLFDGEESKESFMGQAQRPDPKPLIPKRPKTDA